MRKSTVKHRKADWEVVHDSELMWHAYPYSVERPTTGATAGVYMTRWGANRRLAKMLGE